LLNSGLFSSHWLEHRLYLEPEYRLGIGEDLRARAFDALTLCVSGFLHYAPNQLDPATDLEVCRENSLVFLYRLLFVMFAEDRGLLPYRTNHLYTDNRSLARHRDEVAGRLDRVQATSDDYSRSETAIWEDLQGLFDLIDRGHARYGVAPYNGGLFDLDQRPFLSPCARARRKRRARAAFALASTRRRPSMPGRPAWF
jgi:hypothetical protein